MVLECSGNVGQQYGNQRQIQNGVQSLQGIANFFVFLQQVGQRQHAKPYRLDAFGRTHQPARQRNGHHQRVQSKMAQLGTPTLQRAHVVRQGRRLVGGPPDQAQQRQEKHRHPSPFVPGIKLQFLRRQRQALHVKAQAQQAENHQRHQPMQEFGSGIVMGGRGVEHKHRSQR